MLGFPDGSRICLQCRKCRRLRFDPESGKVLCRRAWQPTPVFLPAESHRQRSLVGYSPGGCKESDTTEATSHAHIWLRKSFLRMLGVGGIASGKAVKSTVR